MVINLAPGVEMTLLKRSFAWVIDAIAADSEAGAILLCFFRADVADESAICDIFSAVLGNVGLADESNGVGTPDPAADALCEASKLVCGRYGPVALVDRVPQELAVVEQFTRGLD